MSLAVTSTTSLLIWVGALIVVALFGGLVMLAVRRRMFNEPDAAADAGLMEQLRRMLERGEMTQDEYDLARRKIVERARGNPAPRSKSDQ
ncbi:MAG: SHOCT domain-containing protein [Planctomycetota bacterium]|nr:MAG: SHOCT domain-containing protein [Planctomycetota bacterium]